MVVGVIPSPTLLLVSPETEVMRMGELATAAHRCSTRERELGT